MALKSYGYGRQEFVKKGKELKEEAQKEEEEKNNEVRQANSQLDLVRANSNLMNMYKENVQVGSEYVASSLPLMKVHSVGKSSTNELANGQEPQDGYFFYKPTKEEFKGVTCHILTVSKGYYAKGLQDKEVFNQIMAGAMVDENGIKPFIMYFTGLKLSYLWNFGKEVSVYTKSNTFPIPMFALTVNLTTEKVKTSYGASWVIKFAIVKDNAGFPFIVTDEEVFKNLRDSVDMVEGTINSLIEAKSNTVKEDELTKDLEMKEDSTSTVNSHVEDVNPEDIPF